MTDSLKKVDLLSTQQVGRVMDNKDPRKLLRLKVYVKGIYEESDVTKLPWVFPLADASRGGRPDSGGFSVPEIDSEVLVSWPSGDVYSPYYSLGRSNALVTPKEPFAGEGDSYPNSTGFITPNLVWGKIDKEKEFEEFYSKNSGKLLHFDKSGNLQVNIPGKLILKIGGDIQIQTDTDFVLVSKGKTVVVAADNIQLEGKMIHENSGISSGYKSTVEASIAEIEQLLQELKQKAENVRARTDEVKSKIGKETTK